MQMGRMLSMAALVLLGLLVSAYGVDQTVTLSKWGTIWNPQPYCESNLQWCRTHVGDRVGTVEEEGRGTCVVSP